ncbi:hypothetical protein FDT66_05170 [Polaribacter aestuariivivens]|uniref:Porin family protein n=1 Tax=Polaribacter aestuariivivens TaxID=2304626 RepID=A0A5S3NCG8_9FLAO|nr:hypothetical protein [Polaribacter aestuariivivens]TMM31359.1 hypothetical protein FDT66_05170 [Polaribacter aestuariivivens]
MKKLLFITLITLITLTFLGNVNAQNGVFNGGINVGLPTGDADNSYGVTLEADLYYMIPLADRFAIGASAAYSRFFGRELLNTDIADASFLPLSAAIRYSFSPKFVFGANLGYALALNDGIDGGFYYKPIFGYSINEYTQISISYSDISSNGINFSNASLGVLFRL